MKDHFERQQQREAGRETLAFYPRIILFFFFFNLTADSNLTTGVLSYSYNNVEAELLRRQQEELEQIRQRQLVLEQEQDLERQRLEEERQEAERAHAAEAAVSSKLQKPRVVASKARAPGGPGGPGGSGSSAGEGAGRGRIPRPVASSSSSAGPSRVGPGGQVRKLAGKLVMKKMAERLPLKYRDEVNIKSRSGHIHLSLFGSDLDFFISFALTSFIYL